MKKILLLLLILISIKSYAGCSPFEIVNFLPAPGSTDVSVNTTLSFIPNNMLGCSGPTKFRSGFLKIYKSSTNEIVDSININNFYPYGYVSPSGEILSFSLNITLENNTSYYVRLDDHSLYDPCCSNGGDFVLGFGHWVSPNWIPIQWVFTTECISITSIKSDVSCFSSCDGYIDVTVNSDNSNLTYYWNNSIGNLYIDSLCSGNYTFLATNNNGCFKGQSFYISSPSEIQISYISSPSNGSDGSISVDVSGGIMPYTFYWIGENGFQSNYEDIENLSPGNYTLTLTDNNYCQKTIIVYIDNLSTITTNSINNVLYPNPTSGILRLGEKVLNDNILYIICDVYGKVLLEGLLYGNVLDISNLYCGIYFITLNLKNNIKTYKIIKE